MFEICEYRFVISIRKENKEWTNEWYLSVDGDGGSLRNVLVCLADDLCEWKRKQADQFS